MRAVTRICDIARAEREATVDVDEQDEVWDAAMCKRRLRDERERAHVAYDMKQTVATLLKKYVSEPDQEVNLETVVFGALPGLRVAHTKDLETLKYVRAVPPGRCHSTMASVPPGRCHRTMASVPPGRCHSTMASVPP